jgi:FkbH-like protein
MLLDLQPVDFLLLKRNTLRRQFLTNENLQDVRIAVLGGSTTNEVVDLLELLLLADGFRPAFYQSEYNRYYEEAVFEPEKLLSFRPDITYIHTSFVNVHGFPPLTASASDFDESVAIQVQRFENIWRSLQDRISCMVIQNNFELPPLSILGNFDSVSYGGKTRFINALNLQFAKEAAKSEKLLIQDINALSARIGTNNWFDWSRWFSYKIPTTADASLAIARSLAAMVRSIYGKSRKCLVLDLDNTLWGGVVGDDGLEKIRIGRETPVAEAYTAFQEYCFELRNRGVLLAVCSKNNEDLAKEAFTHPESVLRLEHFSAFKANWLPKHENILSIAAELNLGVDSFVFVDDNPAERALVAAQLPTVAVPDVGSDVSKFASVLQATQYFEPIKISAEDWQRAELYAANSERAALQSKFANYGEYLDSLNMTAEIDAFRREYLERIAQLTNKTNQFNLTTRRLTLAETEAVASDPQYVTLYGKLSDKFGDNGLISVVIGRREASVLHVELWLMSCRVLNREMELAMLDSLVEHARKLGISVIRGYYIRTPKNGMVADHYQKLGFHCESLDPEGQSSQWALSISEYEAKTRHIRIREPMNGRHFGRNPTDFSRHPGPARPQNHTQIRCLEY